VAEAQQVLSDFVDPETLAGCNRNTRGDFTFVPDVSMITADEE
jgi:hypothetical protein